MAINIPSWNLRDLYSAISDPKIKLDQNWLTSKIVSFNKTYKNKKNIDLLQALKLYTKIIDKLSILGGFAYLKFTENTQDQKITSFYQQISEYLTDLSAQLSWFSIYLTQLDTKTINKVLASPQAKDFHHFLITKQVFKNHTLSEPEENIMIKKEVSGSTAFVRLYDEIDASQTYSLTLKGKKEALSYAQITQYAKNHPDRVVRQKAVEALAQTLSDPRNSKLYTYILNTLLLDKKQEDTIRNYTYPQEATFLHYEITPEIVSAVIEAVKKSWRLGERFYKAKAHAVGHKLFEWDRYSDVYTIKSKQKITWREAQDIVIRSFEKFSPQFSEIAQLFFKNNWIDAQVRPGKRGGAYCSYISPSKHPYVFLNFNETIEDTLTLAHELGHAVHGYLARKHNVLEYDASTTIAEIASTFAESLVFDTLFASTKNSQEKVNLLANKIQGSFSTILRQTAFYLFEEDLHLKRRTQGELTSDQISTLYQKHLQPMFRSSLTLTDNHQYLWMPISHFYHYNFYVFTYAFGELLAISLYALYKNQGQEFVKKYIQALAAGGSLSPLEITKLMGVDITNKQFWLDGLQILQKEVEEFEQLVLK